MELLIDRKFWNNVIKKLSPKTVLSLKRNLKPQFFNESPLKKECVIYLNSKESVFTYGSVLKQCLSDWKNNPLSSTRKENNEIEKAILKLLIETKGFSEKIKYQPYLTKKADFVVEQQKPISTVEKGFVYLIRNEDIYKIGITDNLLRRFNQLKPDEVLNVVRCSNFEKLEKDLHKKFKEFRIPQTEYFRLNNNQLEQVNIEMTKGAKF